MTARMSDADLWLISVPLRFAPLIPVLPEVHLIYFRLCQCQAVWLLLKWDKVSSGRLKPVLSTFDKNEFEVRDQDNVKMRRVHNRHLRSMRLAPA